MDLSALLIGFVFISLIMSFIYFSIFSKNQERFVKFWVLFWVAYSLSLIFLVLSLNYDNLALLECRKIFDMYNILFLLFASYAFVHLQIPSYWLRFSFYLTIWTFIGIYYLFDPISLYIPIAIFQIIATLVLCRIIYKYWIISIFNKVMAIIIFAFWGIGKSFTSIFELYFSNSASLYLVEIVFTNILSFCIFIIYIQRVQSNAESGERLYRIIAENATDVIFYYTFSPHPAFKYITPSVEALTGYPPSEFYSNPEFYLNIVDPIFFKDITDVFTAKSSSANIKVIKIIDKDDVPKWCEFHNKIIYEDAKPLAIESFVRDISLMKEAEEHLLQSKNARDQLLSNISHELKTPVSSILGYVNGILDGIITDECEKNAALQLISSKTITLERLIDDLFLLSKLETHQFSFQFTEICAEELCNEMIKNCAFDINTAGIELEIDADFEELKTQYVIVDFERIKQVFSNIIYNAIKYMAPNGKITVAFKINKELTFLETSVSDTGTGIPKEDLPYVFDRFFRAQQESSPRKIKGNGLGLTISKQIIEGHNGNIGVSSILHQGSVFYFNLPLFNN